jgi:O-antigen/teichoic acid export membrane protein
MSVSPPEEGKGSSLLKKLSPFLTLAKESAVYGASSIIARTISVFLVPIYTRIFTPYDYGIIAMVQAIVGFLSLFLGLGAEASVGAYFYDRKEPSSQRRLIASYIFLQIATAILLGSLLVILRDPVAQNFLGQRENSFYLILGAGILFFSSLQGVIFNLFRLLRKPITLMILNTVVSLLQIGGAFVLVVILRIGITGSLLGQMLGYAVGFVVGGYLLRGWLNLKEVHREEIRGMIRLGIPYLISCVAIWSIGTLNRFFLEGYLSLKEVGFFSLANSLSQVFALLTGAFQMAFGPYALSIKDQENARRIYSQVLTLFLVFGFGAGLFFSLFAPEMILILATPTYLPAREAVPYLVLYLLGVALGYIASIGSWIAKRTQNLLLPTLLGGAVSLVGNVFLIPLLGMRGSALASVLGQGVYVAYLFLLSQRVYPIPYRFREIGVVLFLFGACVVAMELLPLNPLDPISLLCRLALFSAYPMGIFLLRVIPFSMAVGIFRSFGSRK